MMILSKVEGIWSVWSLSKPSILNIFLIWNLLLIWLYKWTSINNIGLKVVVLWSLLNLSKYFISFFMSLGWWTRNIGDMGKNGFYQFIQKTYPIHLTMMVMMFYVVGVPYVVVGGAPYDIRLLYYIWFVSNKMDYIIWSRVQV